MTNRAPGSEQPTQLCTALYRHRPWPKPKPRAMPWPRGAARAFALALEQPKPYVVLQILRNKVGNS